MIKLKKELGFSDLLFASITGVIGSGWIFGGYYTAKVAGPASIISWILGAIFIFLLAISWGEISSLFPASGAVARYMKYTNGALANSISGWASVVEAIMLPAVESIATVSIIQMLLSKVNISVVFVNASGLPTPLGAVASFLLVLLFFTLSYRGIRNTARVNIVVNYTRFIIMPLFIIIAIYAALSMNLAPNLTTPSFAPYGYTPIFTALPSTGVIFSYLGFRQAIDVAGEAKKPAKDLWRVLILTVVITGILFTLFQVVLVLGMVWNSSAAGTLGVMPGDWAGLTTSLPMASFPLFDLAYGLKISYMAWLVGVAGFMSTAGVASMYLASTPRILFGMSKEGYLSRHFEKLSEKYRIPVFGLLATLAVTIILLIMGVAGVFVTSVGGFWIALTSIGTSTLVFAYSTGPLVTAILRRKLPEYQRPFKIPAYFAITMISFVITTLLIYWGAGSLFSSEDPYGGYMLIILILVGALIYPTYNNKKRSDINSGIWMIIYLLTFLPILYLGSYQTNILPFPYDWITEIILGSIFFLWAIYSSLPTETIKSEIDKILGSAAENE
ncbi:MAG: APC family permease [Nitrososphaeria archaeon]